MEFHVKRRIWGIWGPGGFGEFQGIYFSRISRTKWQQLVHAKFHAEYKVVIQKSRHDGYWFISYHGGVSVKDHAFFGVQKDHKRYNLKGRMKVNLNITCLLVNINLEKATSSAKSRNSLRLAEYPHVHIPLLSYQPMLLVLDSYAWRNRDPVSLLTHRGSQNELA